MMFQSIINGLLGCSHRRTTFPLTPSRRSLGVDPDAPRTYVVCLDCGKEFAYDWDEMRVGRAMVQIPVAEAQPMYR
jgi:hypothetical protein